MKNRSLAILASIIVLLIVAFVVVNREEQLHPQRQADTLPRSEAKELKVAALLNMTGPSARFDAPKAKTLEIALERVTELYPDVPLTLRIFDAGGGPEGATVAVRGATTWGAEYYLSGTSPTALAIAAQVRDRAPLVVQLANAANPDFGPPRQGEYRFWPDWRQEADLIGSHIVDSKFERILLIYSADPYSTALRKELIGRIGNQGITVTELQFDPAATPDFRPALVRAAGDGADAVVVFGLPPGLKALIAQMAETGWSGTTIGGVNINLAVSDYVQAGLQGALWLVETESMVADPKSGSEVAIFRDAYSKRFGDTPAFYTLYLADAVYFAAAAEDGKASASMTTVDAANRVTEFEGASGQIRVLPNRTLAFEMRFIRAH